MDCINTEAIDVNLRMCPVIRYSDIRSHSHNSSFTSWAKVDRATLLQHQMAGSPSRFVLCPVIFQQQLFLEVKHQPKETLKGCVS